MLQVFSIASLVRKTGDVSLTAETRLGYPLALAGAGKTTRRLQEASPSGLQCPRRRPGATSGSFP